MVEANAFILIKTNEKRYFLIINLIKRKEGESWNDRVLLYSSRVRGNPFKKKLRRSNFCK